MRKGLSIEATFSRSIFFTTYATEKIKDASDEVNDWSQEQHGKLLIPSRSYLHILSLREKRECNVEGGYNEGSAG
jgi:hypothetical protein